MREVIRRWRDSGISVNLILVKQKNGSLPPIVRILATYCRLLATYCRILSTVVQIHIFNLH